MVPGIPGVPGGPVAPIAPVAPVAPAPPVVPAVVTPNLFVNTTFPLRSEEIEPSPRYIVLALTNIDLNA
jgi:hypothetical protein